MLADEITASATTLEALIEHDPFLSTYTPDAARLGFDLQRLVQAMQGWAQRLPSIQDEIQVRAVLSPTQFPVAERMARLVSEMYAIAAKLRTTSPSDAVLELRTLTLRLDECVDMVEAIEARLTVPQPRELPANVVPLRRSRAPALAHGGDAA